MDQLVRFVIFFVLFVPVLFGFFTVMNVLFPARIVKIHTILQGTTSRSFWIGLVNVLFLVPITLLLFSLGDITTGPLRSVIMLPALVLLAVLLGLSSLGLLSMVNRVGDKLMPDQSLLKKTFWGTLLLTLACALPLVGWFLLLPYVLIIGVGAVILSFFQRNPP
ncbi:MAG TPA: hypothetical protein DCX53_00655 [Anaerolineae bacterium]|nr:hypothetical protein [Anaerolineae bacterium]